MTVQTPRTLLIVMSLAVPGIGSAQVVVAPLPDPQPPPAVLKETLPESGGRSIDALKSSSWWERPADNSEVPRWTIGHTLEFKTAGGVALSVGLFGRRADPMPLFLSQNVSRDTQRLVSNSVTAPETYRLQWDAKFGVTAPLLNGPKLKIDALGEVFVPLSSVEPSGADASRFKSDHPAFSKSPGFRFGIVSGF